MVEMVYTMEYTMDMDLDTQTWRSILRDANLLTYNKIEMLSTRVRNIRYRIEDANENVKRANVAIYDVGLQLHDTEENISWLDDEEYEIDFTRSSERIYEMIQDAMEKSNKATDFINLASDNLLEATDATLFDDVNEFASEFYNLQEINNLTIWNSRDLIEEFEELLARTRDLKKILQDGILQGTDEKLDGAIGNRDDMTEKLECFIVGMRDTWRNGWVGEEDTWRNMWADVLSTWNGDAIEAIDVDGGDDSDGGDSDENDDSIDIGNSDEPMVAMAA